jgi:hypothetical protein
MLSEISHSRTLPHYLFWNRPANHSPISAVPTCSQPLIDTSTTIRKYPPFATIESRMDVRACVKRSEIK